MIRTITYRDLTQAQRAKGARKARERLLGLLNNPFLSVDQRAAVYEKIGSLRHWENCTLEVAVPAPPPPPALQPAPKVPALPERTPQHHDVVLKEDVGVKDKLS